jgi:hypothetical protein
VIAVVDWGALVQVLWTSALAGVGVTAIYGLVIVGVTRAVDARRNRNAAGVAAYGAVGLVSLAVVAGAIVFGIIVMTSK